MTDSPTKKTGKFKRLSSGAPLSGASRASAFKSRLIDSGGAPLKVDLGAQAAASLGHLIEMDGNTGKRGAKRYAVESALINEANRRRKSAKPSK